MAPGEKAEASPVSSEGVDATSASFSASSVGRDEKVVGISSIAPAFAAGADPEKTAPAPGLGADFDSRDRSGNDGGDDDEDNGSIESKDELALSKGRCIALVATVTGASFLNVSPVPIPV